MLCLSRLSVNEVSLCECNSYDFPKGTCQYLEVIITQYYYIGECSFRGECKRKRMAVSLVPSLQVFC